jgi:ketosteroid isomerase-like protein
MQPTVHAITVDVAEIEGRGDLAYIRGTYSETLSFGGNEPVDLEGKYVWILKKQADGSWLVTVGISNSNQPPADTDT